MKIILETDLEPKKFREFIESFQNNKIKANYDTGNSAALGYDMKEEFREIGKYFGNIHIKDRKFQGDTVPLGYGDVDITGNTSYSAVNKTNSASYSDVDVVGETSYTDVTHVA